MADHDDKVREHTEPSRPPSELLPSYERVVQIASQHMLPPEKMDGMYDISGHPATPGESVSEEDSQKTRLKLPDLDPEQAKWLNSQIEALHKDRRFRRALQAILDKRQDWCKEINLDDLLSFHAVLAVGGNGVTRKTRELLWSVNTRKTWKALKEFPSRLRSMAEEVEQVSCGPGFNPQALILDDTPMRKFVKQQFARLPRTLRLFAAFVERQTSDLPAMSSQFPPAIRGYSKFVGYTSLWIRVTTGRYRDAETAELLESTALALGSKKQFDIQTLQKLRSRQKRRKAKS